MRLGALLGALLLLLVVGASRAIPRRPRSLLVYGVLLKDVPMMTRDEIRERLKRVYDLARTSGKPTVWDASRAAVTAATSGQNIRAALDGLAEACRDSGSHVFREWRATPSTPVPPAEADRHLRGVLDREGVTDAKCTKKQYGGSWVTACE